MKKSVLLFLVAAMSVVGISSCDFIRSLAGRPTSDRLEEMRAEERAVLEEQAAAQAAVRAADSLRRANESALAAFNSEGVIIKSGSRIASLANAGVGKGLYIAMGSFSKKCNADKLSSSLEVAGYSTAVLPYINGMFLVATSPVADWSRVRDLYMMLKLEDFFPKDAWILECE